MDLITSLLRIVRKHDFVMVVMDRLTKVAHFILVKATYSTSDVVEMFLTYVVKLHHVPKNIVLDINANFNSKFWKELF